MRAHRTLQRARHTYYDQRYRANRRRDTAAAAARRLQIRGRHRFARQVPMAGELDRTASRDSERRKPDERTCAGSPMIAQLGIDFRAAQKSRATVHRPRPRFGAAQDSMELTKLSSRRFATNTRRHARNVWNKIERIASSCLLCVIIPRCASRRWATTRKRPPNTRLPRAALPHRFKQAHARSH